MPRRRPVRTNAGAAACLVLIVSACSGPVEVTPTDTADAAACTELVDALPDQVADVERRDVEPDTGSTAAWRDPAIVLRCGVPQPADFDALSTCQITNGVAWFIPDEQITGQPVEVLMTTIGRSPGVEVRLPADYFPPATAMVDLASSVKAHTERVGRCG